MALITGQLVRWGAILTVLFGTSIACALAIHHFYGLHGVDTLWPYKNLLQQYLAILRTALIAVSASSWAIWFGARRGRSPRTFALCAALGTLITLVLYGVAGCAGVLGGNYHNAFWNWASDFIFPSTFFAEFNFLTFIFEIAPTTAVAELILLYFFSRKIIPAGPTEGLPISG